MERLFLSFPVLHTPVHLCNKIDFLPKIFVIYLYIDTHILHNLPHDSILKISLLLVINPSQEIKIYLYSPDDINTHSIHS